MGTPARPEARLRGGAIWSRPPYFRLPLGERLLPARGALPGEMAAQQPLRVLALAGFRQSERGFREKTGALRKALRGRAELVCLSGPHLVSGAEGSEGAGPDSGETEMHLRLLSGFVSITPLSILPRCFLASFLPPAEPFSSSFPDFRLDQSSLLPDFLLSPRPPLCTHGHSQAFRPSVPFSFLIP